MGPHVLKQKQELETQKCEALPGVGGRGRGNGRGGRSNGRGGRSGSSRRGGGGGGFGDEWGMMHDDDYSDDDDVSEEEMLVVRTRAGRQQLLELNGDIARVSREIAQLERALGCASTSAGASGATAAAAASLGLEMGMDVDMEMDDDAVASVCGAKPGPGGLSRRADDGELAPIKFAFVDYMACPFCSGRGFRHGHNTLALEV